MITPALALLKSLKPNFQIDVLSLSNLGASVYYNNPHCEHIYLHSEINQADDFIEPYDFMVAAHRDNRILELVDQLKKPVFLIEKADQEQAQSQQALNFIQRGFSESNLTTQSLHYQLFPSADDRASASHLLNKNIKYIGMHLGCHGINKKDVWLPWYRPHHEKLWPIKQFIELANGLKLKYPQSQIVLTGGENEQILAHQFKQHIPDAIDLTGKTNLLELAAVMEKLAVYVSPDTGTMHAACAMNTPLVALFGPTNAIRTGPYPTSAFRQTIEVKSLAELNYQQVLTAIDILLGVYNRLDSIEKSDLLVNT
ncbi:MAG TPA: glycosyltransferase family 9 protein [Methylophilaceae bacterium]|nr:glycosyltransferase family 9 protein [Methylophilaceae bacterium]